jgi:GGDEF domain-containing protein
MAASTKSQIADLANSHSQKSVLVFHIAGFHKQSLELGARVGQLLVQQVAEQMRAVLGPTSAVSAERSGTVVVVLDAEREEAEKAAKQLIAAVEAAPLRLTGRREGISVKLGCGIIAFTATGGAEALSVPVVVPAAASAVQISA